MYIYRYMYTFEHIYVFVYTYIYKCILTVPLHPVEVASLVNLINTYMHRRIYMNTCIHNYRCISTYIYTENT